MKKFLFLLAVVLWSQSHFSRSEDSLIEIKLDPDVQLLLNVPDRYVVSKEDELTAVIGFFVQDPATLLTERFGKNLPQLRPGDIVALNKKGNLRSLQIIRVKTTETTRNAVRLSPEVRILEEKRGVPVIPIEAIQQFLNRPKIITLEELETAGYIIANPNQTLFTSTGDEIYVRKLDESTEETEFIIVRLGPAYPSSEEEEEDEEAVLYEAVYLGEARLKEVGDPTILTVINAVREIRQGDRLLPTGDRTINEDFHPHNPEADLLEGAKIISVVEGVSQIGQYQVVVINKGTENGLERGHILAVNRSGHSMQDDMDEDKEIVKLPGQRAGTLLVFKPFETLSYALVMKATFPIKTLDEVTAP